MIRGVFNFAGVTTLTNATLSGNAANSGRGICHQSCSSLSAYTRISVTTALFLPLVRR